MSDCHVLIIDDNLPNLEVLTELVTLAGCSATPVDHPGRLPAVLNADTHFDIAFIDLEMPEMDGYAVLEMLKSDRRFSNVRKVACTVHTNEISNARARGFDSFIGKPLDADRFAQYFTQILSGGSVWVKA